MKFPIGEVTGGVNGSVLALALAAGCSLLSPTIATAAANGDTSMPLWTAGMEGGTLDEWYASGCGDMYNTLDGKSVPSQGQAHTGKWSVKMSISATSVNGQTSATRLYRWCEQPTNRELYYSAWYFFPVRYTANLSGWLNLAQWKGVTWDNTRNDPFFILGLSNSKSGAMRFQMTWWPGLKIEGPQAGQSGGRIWTSPIDVPVGQWVHVEVRHVCTGDFTGAVQMWQDGVEVLHLEGVRTRYQNADCQWSANDYGENISPTPVIVYLDDVAISQTRVADGSRPFLLTVTAKGSSAKGVLPRMQVRVDGVLAGQFDVRADGYAAYTVGVALDPDAAHAVDVVFVNDAYYPNDTPPEDRNLYVSSLRWGETTLTPTSAGVTYDVGKGAAAFDGDDVLAGQSAMGWSGALRFKLAALRRP